MILKSTEARAKRSCSLSGLRQLVHHVVAQGSLSERILRGCGSSHDLRQIFARQPRVVIIVV